ncbi:RNA polymerase sigma factor [Streptacidiphilus carbonis]|uniref:RNA polymerase sigma factor n=1 Tax=Streptacidiphilus carbonis TaxID=105422 RepID=UPI0005A712DF|nr:sigma-70 family RNA polymerase sigma factor [Streptacidiphilus carbonis]
MQHTPDTGLVAAASAGDQRALDDLVAECLPLVYNVVGRALSGHADVDDVVQDTMLSVVDNLDGLRDAERFRSWLVSIAMQKIRERWRRQQTRPAPGFLDEVLGVPDPEADFVDLTIVRLELSDQRLEIAEATRWIEPAERDVLSLWWLEAAGELSRAELAEALRLTPQHTAVRVQRVKERLEAARVVVRALRSTPPCPELAALTGAWDGIPAALWRKRLVRHTADCQVCSRHRQNLLPPEGLLAGLALVPLPPAFSLSPAVHGTLGHAVTSHGVTAHAAAHAAAGLGGKAAHLARYLMAKPVAAATAGAVALGGGAAAGYAVLDRPPHRAPHQVTAARLPSAVPAPSAAATSVASPSASPTAAPAPAAPVYGRTVDRPDSAPATTARPGPLPVRPQTAPLSLSGTFGAAHPGPTGEMYVLDHRGDNLTVTGRGYLLVRWQLPTLGQILPPTWTGLTGKLFHVASGGGRRMDDREQGTTVAGTWMGDRDHGYDTLVAGGQQMWQNEYYYLDGTVTLHLDQAGLRYSLIVAPSTWQAVNDDIDHAPDPAAGLVRYGLVRDTGDDAAPVPQYLTRSSPADPFSVPQLPHLSQN